MKTEFRTTTSSSVRRLRALGDETRWQVVQLLAGGELCVCQLTEAIRAAQSRLSFHLRVLKEAGVILDRRDGRWIYYRLSPNVLSQLADDLAAVQNTAIRSTHRLCD